MIGVTSFFRDPEAFKALEKHFIPRLFASKPEESTVRVWVPACSTGEEAYSITILLHEQMDSLKKRYKLQVFATDIDSKAIAAARSGIYPASIASNITPDRLSRFFTAEPDGSFFRIHKGIRDLIVFSEHDLIKDPPFSRLDLISCRNLLIYMGRELQKKLIPLFNYALVPGGLLFLGTSENVSEFSDQFSAVDNKRKIYQSKLDSPGSRRRPPGGIFSPGRDLGRAASRTAGRAEVPAKLNLRELAEKSILRQVAPAGALVNGQGDILFLHGRTGMYLEPASGESGINNILKMARKGLRRELTMALHKAAAGKETVRVPGLRVKTNGDFTSVNLAIYQVESASCEIPLYMVILEEFQVPVPGKVPDAAPVREDEGSGIQAAADTNESVEALKKELQLKEDYLRASNEELETSNEELRSSIEEMQSINEELQSTNEELETSKEELQSVNEELATVNSELQTKVADLSRINNDMNNLLAGTGIGTVFVDRLLCILRFTPAITKIIHLIRSDIGRPVGHIVSRMVGYDRLVADTKEVLDTLIPKDLEVQTEEGEWYRMRIQPYRTLENVIEGAVITFVNITESKQAAEKLQISERISRLALQVGQVGAFEVELESGQGLWTPELAEIWGIPDGFKGDLASCCRERVHPDDLSRVKEEFERILDTRDVGDMEFRLVHSDGAVRWIRWCGQVVESTLNGALRVVGINQDITEQKIRFQHGGQGSEKFTSKGKAARNDQ